MSLINIERTIELDVYDHDTTPSVIKAIQLDEGTRAVYAVIQNSRQGYDIGQNAEVKLTVLRPDKTRVQITGQTFGYSGTDDTIYGAKAELSDVALAVKGNLKAQFKITSGEQELRTEIFTINNGEALDAGDGDWAGDLDGHNLDEMAENIETLQTDMAAVNEDVSDLKEGLNGKVAIEQGTVHAGEALIIGADGKVTTGEAGVSVDPTLTIAGKAADAKAAGDAIEEISDQLLVTAEVPASATVASYRLNESDGFCSVNNEYQLKKYGVSVGTNLRIKSDDRFQFQKSSSVPTSGTSNRVGDTTYGAGTFHLTVPYGATYLIVSTPKASSVAIVETIEYKIEDIESKTQALEDRTLKDSIAPYLAKYGNRIREIDLSSYLFDDQKQAAIARVVPATMASRLDGLTKPANYPCTRIGRRVLYLPKGSKVITNIDSFYDGTTFPNGTFNLGDYRGVILANINNNGETVTGTVAWGREKFDGVFREIDITYTDYYCLFYRTDVDYTPECYLYYPEDHAIETDDVRVTDITADVRMVDGYYYNNGTAGGWSDNLTTENGGAGRYQFKSAMFHLTGNAGKSLYIDGMTLTTNWNNLQLIKFTDNGDDTYTPTTDGLVHLMYPLEKRNYITIPLSDEDHFRVSFPATASPAFMRFLIVPNDLLVEKGLVNPIFYGKKILGYGDSYIAGQSASFTWHKVLAEKNYGKFVNRGHGGAGLCFGASGSLVTADRIAELDEDADIYILTFGRNDNSTDIKIGENDDALDTSVEWNASYLMYTATFKGAMNYLFNYLETRHPFAKILMVTPWGFENNENVTSGLSCLDYIDAIQEMSKKWGITCFNAAGDAGIHVRIEAFRTQYFLAYNDQSHLNNNGHLLMAKRIERLLTNILYDD